MEKQGAHTRLAVYGSLAPGECNHHVIAPFGGIWIEGVVRGRRFFCQGYPVFQWDPKGEPVAVKVLLSRHIDWQALDEFEGENYRRICVPVHTGRGILPAHIYADRRQSLEGLI